MTMRTVVRNTVRSARRPRQWSIFNANGAIVAATDAGATMFNLSASLATTLGQTLANVTVGPIRLDFSFNHQATAVIGDRSAGQWGIILVSAEAFAAGNLSVPDPTTDADWMAHGTWNTVADVAGAISRPRDGRQMVRNDSMRKMNENNKVLVLKFRATVIDDPISIFVAGRTLYLLR